MPVTGDVFWIYVVAAFGFGAIFGSFLNALLFRFNTGHSMNGRSRCMRCNHTLGSLDLVPIFSWLFLKAKCRYCSTKISFQYPLVELLAGVLLVKLFFLFGVTTLTALWFVVWMTILFIVVYDLRHMIIPWSSSVLLLLLSILHLFTAPLTLYAIIAGPVLALPFLLISAVSKGHWMGWGDSGLELSLGMLLGLSGGVSALLLGVWSGAIVGMLLVAAGFIVKRFTPTTWFPKWALGLTIQSEIPFAPFLALGAVIVFFFHVNFFATFTFF